jgi:hypothetical protein
MSLSYPSRRVLAGLALALFTAACSDSTAPTFSDPGAISAELERVDAAFTSATYESFSNLSGFMAPGGGPMASAMLGAFQPEAMLEQDQPRAAAAAKSLRAMIPRLSGPQLSPIIHDTLLGRVYVWDATAGYYVHDNSQTGPANGVRFILYAVDPNTALPTTPLTPVGRADVLDLSTGPTALSLRVLVQNAAGSTTYLDYTASVTAGTNSFGASVTGFVANGLSAPADRRLDYTISFSATETATTADVSADAAFDVSGSSVSLEVHDDAHFAGNTITFSRDFRFHRPGETVTVAGSLTFTETATGYSITGQVAIRINGAVFVTVTFAGENATPSRELSQEEQGVVLVLLDALEDVWDSIEDFFDPLDLFAA